VHRCVIATAPVTLGFNLFGAIAAIIKLALLVKIWRAVLFPPPRPV
jgi:hypothetical protein